MGTATAVFATGVLDIQEVDLTVDGIHNPSGSITFPFRSR